MRSRDAERAALAVRKSLEQILDVVAGEINLYQTIDKENDSFFPDTLNVCASNYLPAGRNLGIFSSLIHEVVEETPIPGLGEGKGEFPRFNAELGPFFGFTSALRAGWHRGGFLNNEDNSGFIAGIELAVRLGIGLEGVMNESGDGLIFVDVGILRDATSTLNIGNDPAFEEFGAVTAAIPSRSAIITRVRMPFWLIPFDLLLAAPVLAVTSPETLTRMAVVAANGGLLGWEAGIATSVGRFQVILGREAGIYFYGHGKDDDRVLYFPEEKEDLYLLDIRSIRVDVPILEYRNFRTFSRNQSSSLHIQLYAGLDIPTRVEVIAPENADVPNARSVWHFGIRASLDWRHYF
jgi:hypothetical protein